MNKLLFPVLLITLSAGASIVYAVDGDYRHALYWFFAAGIQAVVTF